MMIADRIKIKPRPVFKRKPLLRSLPLAKQCVYLGNRLTADEVKEKQLVGCRSCNNEIPAFHCKLPGAKKFNDGPYTRLGECMGCADWEQEHGHEQPKSHILGLMQKNPESLKMVQLSFAYARECRFNNGSNGILKDGKFTHRTFQCSIKGTVKGVDCATCLSRQPVVKPTRKTIFTRDSRHLLYHIWPKKTSTGTWQRNLDQLKQRWPLFTGMRIIAVATSSDSHSLQAVRDYMYGYDCEFIHVENNPSLREVQSFLPLFERIEGLPGYTFYAQGKGVSKPVNTGVTIHQWTSAMYELLLDYWPLVADMLKSYPMVGTFKKSIPGAFGNSISSWHYSGSFFWVRNDDLFTRNWRAIERTWFGIESYPSMVFGDSEAGCLFHSKSKQFNLYKLHYWNTVEKELAAWRKEQAAHRFAGGLSTIGSNH